MTFREMSKEVMEECMTDKPKILQNYLKQLH